MFTIDNGPEFSGAFREAIDKALIANRASQPKRQYLGASLWGEPCKRKLGHIFHRTPEDEGTGFPANILRVFDMGHDGEERMAEYLRLAGFDLHTHKPDGGQYGFEACDGKLKGHIDGVIIAGPELPGITWPALWENKELNDKSWNDVVKSGVKKANHKYYVQAQVYMGYLELPNALFTTRNRNTGAVHAELIPFDGVASQQASDKAVQIVTSLSPYDLEKCTEDEADARCKFCNFRLRCWSKPIPSPNTPTTNPPKPTWLQRK